MEQTSMLSIKSALGSVFSHCKKVITHFRSDATWLSSQFTVGRTIQPLCFQGLFSVGGGLLSVVCVFWGLRFRDTHRNILAKAKHCKLLIAALRPVREITLKSCHFWNGSITRPVYDLCLKWYHSTIMCFAYLLCLQYGKTALDFAESFGRKVHRKLGISLPRSNLASLCCKQPETGPTFLVKEGHKLSNIGSRVYRTSLADPTMVENSFSLFDPSLI